MSLQYSVLYPTNGTVKSVKTAIRHVKSVKTAIRHVFIGIEKKKTLYIGGFCLDWGIYFKQKHCQH